MQKILSYLLLIALLTVNNLTFVFATNQNQTTITTQIETNLDKLENKLQTTLNNVETKTTNEELKDQIEETKQEIEKYIEESKEELKQETNKQELKEKLEEIQKTVVLKAVSGITPTTDSTENIEKQIDIKTIELNQAKQTLINSLKTDTGYNLMIKTKLEETQILELLNKFDKDVNLELQYDEEDYKVYELILKEESLLTQELLENINDGELPTNLVGLEIIKPELLKIGEINYSGEQTEKLWGMRKYNIGAYQEGILTQTETNGKKIKVGIIDTGIDYNHEDLKNTISSTTKGYDFVNNDSDPLDDQGHGTHVSGTIAGEINGKGVYGINPNVELVGLKICDNKGFCPSYAVLQALKYAKETKLDVLNMSLGAKGNPQTSPICESIQDLTQNGIVVVSAAGNSNIDTSKFVPGGCLEAITVGAVDENLTRASFSNYGEKVDVSAPGVGIYSTYPNNTYKSLNGTSMSTPHIVGLVSVLKTYKQNLTTKDIKEIFKTNAIQVNTESNKKIANFTNVEKIMASLMKTEEKKAEEINKNDEKQKQEEENKKLEENKKQEEQKKKDEEKLKAEKQEEENKKLEESKKLEENKKKDEEKQKQEEQKNSSGSLENKQEEKQEEVETILDESIGLVIQNNEEEQTKINNTEAVEFSNENNEEVKINNTEDEKKETEISSENNEEMKINNLEEEQKQEVSVSSEDNEEMKINSAEDEEENQVINLNGNAEALKNIENDIENDNVEINNVEDEKKVELNIEDEITKTEDETTPDIQETEKENADNAIQETLYATMNVGGNIRYNFTNANIYSYSASNGIIGLSTTSSSFTIYGNKAGSTTLYIKYGGREYHRIYITINNPPQSLNFYVGATRMQVGQNTYLSVTSGNGGYYGYSSNTNVLRISGSNTSWNLQAVGVGTARITLTDSRGYRAYIDITITKSIKPLKGTIGATTMQVGQTTYFNVIDGNGGYNVYSNNTNIAKVSGSNTSWTVQAIGAGTTRIILTDSLGYRAYVDITITKPIRPLKGTIGATTMQVGQTTYFNVLDGNGGYNVYSTNTNIAKVSGSNTSWTVQAVGAGTTRIILTDSLGYRAYIDITITANLTLDKYSITVEKGGSNQEFCITSGNGGYRFYRSNNNFGLYYGSKSNCYQISGLTVGNSIIRVVDNAGKIVSLSVVIKEKISFSNVIYEQIGVGLWQVKFNILGQYKEVGFDMGNNIYKKLSLETDNSYLSYIYNTTTDEQIYVKDFTGKIYVKDMQNNTIYYTNNKLLGYNDNGNVLIANDQENNSIDSNINEEEFKEYLKNISNNENEEVVEINGIKEVGEWIIYQVDSAGNEINKQIKKIDVTKHLRNRNNLSQKDKEDFEDGVLDTLVLNGLEELAMSMFGGFVIEQVATKIGKTLIAKYGKKVAIKLGAKAIPYLGRAMLGYSVGTAGVENGTYALNCASELDKSFDDKGPLYYCGKLSVNGVFIAAGIGISHKFDKYAFKNILKKKVLENIDKVASKQAKTYVSGILDKNYYSLDVIDKELLNKIKVG